MTFKVSFKGIRKLRIEAPNKERATEWAARQLAHWREDKATPVEIVEFDPKAEEKAEKAEKKAGKKKVKAQAAEKPASKP